MSQLVHGVGSDFYCFSLLSSVFTKAVKIHFAILTGEKVQSDFKKDTDI